MPGPHLHVAIFPCPKHVGGSDIWTSSYYLNDEQWWVGWRTTSPFRRWFSGQGAWTLIGYEKWRQNNLTEAYYAEPNPSETREGTYLTPEGHWRVTYDQQGKPIEQDYAKEFLFCDEEGVLLKGNRKTCLRSLP